MPTWKTLHTTTTPPTPSQATTGFTFHSPPSTDFWECPPSTCTFNAPMIYQSMPLSTFKRARVSVRANLTEPFTQGGLAMVIHYPNGDRKWIKTGIEVLRGQQVISTVGKDQWPDWSPGWIIPKEKEGSEVTIELVRDEPHLSVYEVEVGADGVEKRTVVREMTWGLSGDGSEECWVGVYVGKPADKGEDLVVDFKGLVVEKREF